MAFLVFLKSHKALIVAALSLVLNLLGGSGVVEPVPALESAAEAVGAK